MKTFKKFLLIVLIIAALLVVIAFFLPQQVHVERTATINAPVKVVFNQVNDLHSWEKWATWNQIDPNMKIQFIKSGIGENAGYAWQSENSQVGSGELIITASVPYDSIATSMNLMDEGTANGYFLFEDEDGKTNITWAFDSDLGYNPVARWFGLMFDSMIGSDFEKGLDNLKVVSEIIVQEKRPIVEIRNMPTVKIVSIREEIKWEEIEMKMAYMYGELLKFIEKENLLMADVPISIYHKIDNGMIDLEAAIPVEKLPEETSGIIQAREIKAGTYVHADHFGPYDQLEKTHSFIQKWMHQHELFVNGSPIEKYYTDPQNEPDSTKWHTSIYYPI
ncbi:SRPBCC family protein [Sunxiuqinia sp. A32]|uniref:SRPBCC family protein n=1 Tax=Sunxiuqinia sp. A32 TaxID=3461496 RepID=UPI0040463A8C